MGYLSIFNVGPRPWTWLFITAPNRFVLFDTITVNVCNGNIGFNARYLP